MRVAIAAIALFLVPALPALAAEEAPAPLVQPLAPAEETPGFQAVRPLPAAEAPAPPPVVVVAPPPAPAPVAAVAPPPSAPPAPAPAPVAEAPSVAAQLPLLAGLSALFLVLGAALAGFIGISVANVGRRHEEARRRKSVAITLVIELEARQQAFEAVPVPPNAEAGVSFVSALVALADLDYGWRAVQGSLHLLPERLASHLAVHYAAVHHVAKFIKSQSFAAGLRMLQANRIGGHPCPDAGTMREAHVELAAAFRGLDKIVMGLRAAS